MSTAPDALPAPAASRRTARRAWIAGLLVGLGYLAVALPQLGEYGATWDTVMSEYPYGERLLQYVLTGDEAFRTLTATEPAPPVRAPHPDFDSLRDTWLHAYPFAALLSAVSCRVLWTELAVVPAMPAHNLVIPFFAAALAIVLVRFAAPRIGLLGAVAAGVLTLASPRFFANAFYNLKDVPETCTYVPATLLGYVALTRGGLKWWIASGATTGIALACKANALFVPPQFLLFVLLVTLVPGLRVPGALRWSWKGFLLGALAVFVANWVVSPRYWTEPVAGPAARVGEVMRLGTTAFDAGVTGAAGSMVHYAPLLVATTTPVVVLVLFGIGLFSKRLAGPLRAFLIASLAVTLGRNMLPGVRNYDGIRHFLELYPYVCLVAGAGLAALVDRVTRSGLPAPTARIAAAALVGGSLLAPAWQSARTHPNGVGYFNALVGGLQGAQARGIPSATDYWGNGYWQAFAWLNEHAERDAAVLVPIAGHVARSIAPVRLREDLELVTNATAPADRAVVYVAFITRRGAYKPFEFALEERCDPAHEIGVQGGVLLRVFRLERDPLGAELLAIWDRKVAAQPRTKRILAWLREHPAEGREAWAIVKRLDEVGLEETVARLREKLPPELHEGLETVIWNLIDP